MSAPVVIVQNRLQVIEFFPNLTNAPITFAMLVRGVTELKQYSGGSNDGAFFQTGGTPASDTRGVVKLEIENPVQTYYLNRSASPPDYCVGIEYTKNIQVAPGGRCVLTLDNQDYKMFFGDNVGATIATTIPGVSSSAGQLIAVTWVHPAQLTSSGISGARWYAFGDMVYGGHAEK